LATIGNNGEQVRNVPAQPGRCLENFDMAPLSIPRLVKTPIETQAATALRASIVAGDIPAGQRITEIEIAGQMGLSRATVRAALHQLAREGLLTLVPYTGWTVMSLSAQDAWELYTLRSAIERLAAQLVAAAIGNPGKADRLREAYERLVSACKRGHAGRIAEADFGLHQAIIALADHRRLTEQYALLEQQIRVYIRSSDALLPNPNMVIAQHKPIVAAILAGDAEEAGALSEQHNLTEGRRLADHLRAVERRAADTQQGAALSQSSRQNRRARA
jgi:DNA-binding GntR family transcriptional regulator